MTPIETRGERALLATLLEQAIQTLKHRRYPEMPDEVEFFFGHSHFETYAHLLGLDPEAIREKVVRILERRAEESGDSRIQKLLEKASSWALEG